MTTRVNIYIHPELLKKAKKKSKQDYLNFSAYISELIRRDVKGLSNIPKAENQTKAL